MTPNLYDKSRYVLYLRNLHLYTQLGMKVTKIHRVLAFDQRAYLAPYILFNTEKRQHARSDFEKDLYKLMSNAVYGKRLNSFVSAHTCDSFPIRSRPNVTFENLCVKVFTSSMKISR